MISKTGMAKGWLVLAVSLGVLLSGCSAEVGSDAWCAEMKEKPKGDWSANEASEFAKNCVFK